MREKVKTVYYCEFCTRHRLTKKAIAMHEPCCYKNPANFHPCWTCDHLGIQTIERYACDEEGQPIETDYEVKVFSCSKLGKDMYSYRAEGLGLLKKYPREFDNKSRMPSECEAYSQG